jgi:hypothetical protein
MELTPHAVFFLTSKGQNDPGRDKAVKILKIIKLFEVHTASMTSRLDT